eukprot:Phypoly_transcript_30816.p1 GENE.Phypoly_transcript_30816~~Phypoly_transcript_30816.p1  ORF type:complete len:102 (+),score=21.33 Phypoly_transcript_30816:55-360(+)
MGYSRTRGLRPIKAPVLSPDGRLPGVLFRGESDLFPKRRNEMVPGNSQALPWNPFYDFRIKTRFEVNKKEKKKEKKREKKRERKKKKKKKKRNEEGKRKKK